MNAAQQWGLPPEFLPVRFPISDAAKNAARAHLAAGEPVILSLANETEAISLVGTPTRLLVLKIGSMGAGVSGISVKEFPYEGISQITLRPQSLHVTLALSYRSTNNGKTVEVGKRALMAKEMVDNLLAFDKEQAEAAHRAIQQILDFKRPLSL